MRARTASVFAMVAGLGAGAIGIWFWQQEADYQHHHPYSQLSSVLQWAGIGLAVAAVAIVAIGYALYETVGGDRP